MLDARMNPTMHGVWYADDEVQHASRSSIIMVRDGACSFIHTSAYLLGRVHPHLSLRDTEILDSFLYRVLQHSYIIF